MRLKENKLEAVRPWVQQQMAIAFQLPPRRIREKNKRINERKLVSAGETGGMQMYYNRNGRSSNVPRKWRGRKAKQRQMEIAGFLD